MHAVASTDRLLVRCIAGDQSAWRELHRTLHPAAAGFLRQMGLDADEVEDVSQDVFLQLYRYLPRFEQRSELTTWLYRICAGEAARLRRKRTVRRALARVLGTNVIASSLSSFASETGVGWSGLEARREMEAALERMSERQRLVFVLYELHGLRGDEIARVVGCPAATVRGRLREARQLLSRSLAERTARERR